MFDLTGKRALVTGASGGIGGAIAKALHGQGAIVVLRAPRRETLDARASELGRRAHALPCDLCDSAERSTSSSRRPRRRSASSTSSSTMPA